MNIAKLRNYNPQTNTRTCKGCGKDKDLSEFSTRICKNKVNLQVRERCKACSLDSIGKLEGYSDPVKRKQNRCDNRVGILLEQARQRAKKRGLDFNITQEDIPIPLFCPLLGIPIIVSIANNRQFSPSVDRIDNSKGYVKGNVWVVSYKANSIKRDASYEELRLIADNLGSCIKRKNCKNAETPTCSRASGKTEEGSETKDTKVSLQHPPLAIVMT